MLTSHLVRFDFVFGLIFSMYLQGGTFMKQDISFTGATACVTSVHVFKLQEAGPPIVVGFAFLFLHLRRLAGKRKHTVCVHVWNNLHRNVNHLNRYYHFIHLC